MSRRHEGHGKRECRQTKNLHGLVGGAAEVLGAEAGQEVPGDGFQQRFDLDLEPHLDQGFVLEGVCCGV